MRRRALVLLLLILACVATVAAQQAQDLYQRGLVQENASGNLPEAIALYEQAARAAGSDRTLAARALIRAAGSREKLGRRTQAAETYAEVMRAFPEQRAEVTIAQRRLNLLRQERERSPAPAPASANVDVTSTAPFFERYCRQCHTAGSKSGGLDVGVLNNLKIGENSAVWEKILGRLQARFDPPASSPRPDGRTYRTVVVTLQRALDAAYATSRPLNGAERATGIELAGRLSALIWNGAPDELLLDDARRGRLQDSATLKRQVTRMLRDPRSAGLIDGFFTTWLSLDQIKTVRPDPSRYPQFDPDLLEAMETETRLFLASQLREDTDAIEVWTANYTYVNERLARHYGLSGIIGKEFRRVTLPNPNRAGILGQAGPLTALSLPARTSPTVRGRFVLSRFLGVDAPSPPANVPPLAERPATPATMRERMQAHKLNPSCASCHALFDPLGLALENFDALGGWRAVDGSAPIDASGTFADGSRFDGPAELRTGLLKYRDAYYTSLTRQLLAYGLDRKGKAGRVYDYEMPAVRAIVRDASTSNFRWSSILAGICASAPFQMKRIVP